MSLNVSCEVVSSSAYTPGAAMAVYEAVMERYPGEPPPEDMPEWALTGGYFPTVWGSGFSVDVPYLLNQMERNGDSHESMRRMAVALLGVDGDRNDISRPEVRAHNSAWQLAYSVSRVQRGRK